MMKTRLSPSDPLQQLEFGNLKAARQAAVQRIPKPPSLKQQATKYRQGARRTTPLSGTALGESRNG